MLVTKKFQQHIFSVYGESGRLWVDSLEGVLTDHINSWGLSEVTLLDGATYSFVATAKRRDEELVLKAVVPTSQIGEIESLTKLACDSVVSLIEVDLANHVYLMERIRPGTELADVQDDQEATRIWCDVIQSLPVVPVTGSKLVTVQDLFKRIEGDRDSNTQYRSLYQTAETLLGNLWDKESLRILHGDLHHHNVLKYDTSWKAIDPHGYVGPVLFECGPFLHNPIPLKKGGLIPSLLSSRVETVADLLQVSAKHIACWSLIYSVISMGWTLGSGLPVSREHLAIAEALKQIAES